MSTWSGCGGILQMVVQNDTIGAGAHVIGVRWWFIWSVIADVLMPRIRRHGDAREGFDVLPVVPFPRADAILPRHDLALRVLDPHGV